MLNVGAHRQSKRSRFHTCAVERLEPRTLLSAGGIADLTAQPLLVRAKATAGQAPFTPAQISHAYGFDSLPRLANNVSANGSGQTIARYLALTFASAAVEASVALGLPRSARCL